MPSGTPRLHLRLALLALLFGLPCYPQEKIALQKGFPFIEVKINGRGPFRLLIDTGAGTCLLSPGAARKAGLKLDHRAVLTSLSGEMVIPGASDNLVQTGAVSRAGVDILVSEMRQVRTLDPWADGVLGQSFLSRSPYLIDYERKRLWLGDEATAEAERLPIVLSGVEMYGRTILPVTLDSSQAPWRLTLDSGATNIVVSCSERCPSFRDVQKDSLLSTHVGEHPVSRGMLKQVRIGGVTMPSADAVLLHAPAPDGSWDGVLPARWFSAVYVNRSTVRLGLRGVPLRKSNTRGEGTL